MNDTNEALLLNRVDKLEARCRRLQVAVGLCLALPLLAAVGWQTKATEAQKVIPLLRVQNLEVVRANGKLLASIGYDPEVRGATLSLCDQNGEERVWCYAAPSGSYLLLKSRARPDHGAPALTLKADGDLGLAGMRLYGDKKATLEATVDDAKPSLGMFGADGKLLFGVPRDDK